MFQENTLTNAKNVHVPIVADVILTNKGFLMRSHKIGAAKYRSRCKAALFMLKNHSRKTGSQIARECEMSPAAVSIMNKKYGIRPVRHYKSITG